LQAFGGILLGEFDSRHGATHIRITDCQPVECEDGSLDAAVRERADVVGLFRTQKSDLPTLQEDDLQLFHRYFRWRDAVILLWAPIERQGVVFLPHRGITHEFHLGEAKRRRKQLWPAAAAVVLGTIAGAAAMARYETRPSALHAHVAAAQKEPDRLNLELEKIGDSVQLKWDPASTRVRAATYAQLQITDGNHFSRLKLTPVMLTAGAFQYWPENAGVGFRMELFNKAGLLSDVAAAGLPTLRAATIPAATPPQVPAKPLVAANADRREAPPEDDVKPSPFAASPPVRSARRAVVAKPAPTPPAPPVSVTTKPEPQPQPITTVATSPATSESKPMPPVSQRVVAPATKPLSEPLRARGAHVSVDAEPVANSSRFGRAVAHIPLLRRLKKQPQTFVPPKPVREVKPSLTEHESAWVVRPVPVDVKVYVGENGKVEFAEVLTGGHRPELASAAVYAARKWTFTPAKAGEETVPGEVILHFRFAPVE
jgi:protein TonB